MARIVHCVVAAGLLGAAALGAQPTPAPTRAPVVRLQPGFATWDFVDAPPGDPATTGFNLRAAVLFPTRHRWLTPVLGASVTPHGTTGVTYRNNNLPFLFAGNILPLLPARRTGGWLSLELPVLVTYTPFGGSENNPRDYGADLAVELAAAFPLGSKVLSSFGGVLRRLEVYVILDQSLTPNRTFAGDRDRFNPVAFYGITIPIGVPRTAP